MTKLDLLKDERKWARQFYRLTVGFLIIFSLLTLFVLSSAIFFLASHAWIGVCLFFPLAIFLGWFVCPAVWKDVKNSYKEQKFYQKEIEQMTKWS
jgi:hypothetical protein